MMLLENIDKVINLLNQKASEAMMSNGLIDRDKFSIEDEYLLNSFVKSRHKIFGDTFTNLKHKMHGDVLSEDEKYVLRTYYDSIESILDRMDKEEINSPVWFYLDDLYREMLNKDIVKMKAESYPCDKHDTLTLNKRL